MKKKILIISLTILFILIVLGFVTNYIDGGRVSTGNEPKFCIKFVNKNGNKVTYIGLGYKIIRYVSVSPNEPYDNNVGVKMGNWFMKYELKDEVNLNEINDIIVSYLEKNNDISNLVFNYIDEISNEVVVGLIDNNKEKQQEFISKVFSNITDKDILTDINNGAIKFVQSKDTFDGEITKLDKNYIIVEVLKDTKSFKVKDKVTITNDITNIENFKVNDKVRITFNGMILDSNPAQIVAVKIELIQ